MNDPFSPKLKKNHVNIFFIVSSLCVATVGVLAFFIITKNFSAKNEIGGWEDDDNKFNSCVTSNDCYIHSYTECSCTNTMAINKKYINDPELPKTKGGMLGGSSMENCKHYCGMQVMWATETRCHFGKCQLKWEYHYGY